MIGTNELQNEVPATSSAVSGPGRLVRQAREEAKLSLEDLAALIKLSRFTLDAIERDDFSQLNEPVYVRGYYRKLAKVLPVQEAELMAAYERTAGHRTPPHPSKLILAGGPELGSGRRVSLRLAAAIIVVGILIGALAFWGNNRGNTSRHVDTPAVTAPVSAAAQPIETEPAAESAASPSPVSPPPAAEAQASTRAALSAPGAAATAANAGNGALQLQFSGSSWTEIKDATGKVLLSGLIEAGSTQSLDGKPPFVVFLGNAPAVKITYGGQAVDTAQYRHGDNTARITLP